MTCVGYYTKEGELVSELKTIDDVIVWATTHDWPRIVAALTRIRDSGVFVAQGTRAWAVEMQLKGHRVRNEYNNVCEPWFANDADYAFFRPRDGYTLAPRVVERGPVDDPEACKAYHEDKYICLAEGLTGQSVWFNKSSFKTKGGQPPTFSCGCKWYIREPA